MKILIDIRIPKRKRRINNYTIQYILLLLKIVLANLVSIKNKRNINYYESKVHLIVKGSGEQKILYGSFNTNPSEVLVNGIKNNSCKKTCYLEGYINNVTLVFENKITSCRDMFNGLSNIIGIDLSNFDFSEVTTMFWMFYGCSNLEKVNFGDINTSSVTNMRSLFFGCSNLNSIDLSNLNTSKVTTMHYMFYQCKKLKYLDLSSFNTSLVIDIGNMFRGCSSLECLNLYSFQIKSTTSKDYAFDGVPQSLKYCIKDEETKKILLDDKTSDCSDTCFKNNTKIDPCNNNDYKYKYNNICYKECPNNTYSLFSEKTINENNKIECYNNAPNGYYHIFLLIMPY